MERIITFFNVVSPLHDKEQQENAPIQATVAALEKANKKGGHTAEIEALRTLQTHFARGGRDPYGMNRTTVGEAVTMDNVYLGNVAGRWTFTARDWKNTFNKADNPSANEDRQVIEGQATRFVNSHIESMRRLIGSLAP